MAGIRTSDADCFVECLQTCRGYSTPGSVRILSIPIDNATMPRPIQATIHTQAFVNNLAVARKAAPDARVWAVVKANAYGHGIERVFDGLRGADGFALLDLAEAQRVRDLGWRGPILLLKVCSSCAIWSCVRGWIFGTRCTAMRRSTCWRRTKPMCRTGCS